MGGKMIQRQLQSLSVASELAPNASEAISKMKKAHVEKTPFQVAIFDTALSDNRNGRFLLLLVEDNVINQKVALGMLKKMGYRADIASDGYQAIKILETSCYDLIFMDFPQNSAFHRQSMIFPLLRSRQMSVMKTA